MNEAVESSWECTNCNISVPSEKKRCTKCLRWKPGAKPTKEKWRMSMKRKPKAGEDDNDMGEKRRSTRIKSNAQKKNPDTEEEVAAVAKDKKATKKKSSVVTKGKGKGRLKKSNEDSYSEDSADGWDDDDDDDDNGKVTNRQKNDAKKGTVFQPDGAGYYYGGEGKESNIPELMDVLQPSYSKGIVTVLGESSTSLDCASIESAMKELDGYKGSKWLGAYFNINLRNLVNNGTLSEQDGMYELVSGINNMVANPRNNGRFCAECGNKNNLTVCCGEVFYCSDDCKESHLPVHKFNCTHRCTKCGEEGTLRECCNGVKYCGEECRMADYDEHKLTCVHVVPECVRTTERNGRSNAIKRGYCKECKKNDCSYICTACTNLNKTRYVHKGACFKIHLKDVHGKVG